MRYALVTISALINARADYHAMTFVLRAKRQTSATETPKKLKKNNTAPSKPKTESLKNDVLWDNLEFLDE